MKPMLTVSDTTDISKNQVSFEQRERDIEEQEKKAQEQAKREKHSPFKRWTQFNNDHTKELIELAMKFPKAHAILYFLIDQMDNYNAVVCSTTVLTEVLGCSRQTISTNIKILKDLGFLAVYKSGTSNVYTINDTVFWKSWGNNRQYSRFPANVILAESEQRLSTSDIKTEKYKIVEVKKK